MHEAELQGCGDALDIPLAANKTQEDTKTFYDFLRRFLRGVAGLSIVRPGCSSLGVIIQQFGENWERARSFIRDQPAANEKSFLSRRSALPPARSRKTE
jgi:hypothetical protein